ncbi:MAG: alpha/beta hydrolase [Pseudomonadota bacterium]
MTELPRSLVEASTLTTRWHSLLAAAPEADPHPVLVLPGFSTGDEMTLVLRRFITRLGYKSLPWLQGINTGNPRQIEAIMRRFYRLHHSLGCRISIVGHSMGGVYAREIARTFPDAVRCVITLGSPYNAEAGSSNPLVEELFERMSGVSVEELRRRLPKAREERRLPVPATSVFTKADGVVAWRTCIEPESRRSENIRVIGSHAGLGVNADVLRVVADRLAQNPRAWKKFDKTSGCRKLAYPSD